MENWPKSEVNGPWNIGWEVMALYILAGLIEIHPHMKYQLATIKSLEILPWTKILTLIIWPKSKVSGLWYIGHEVMAFYILAGLTEIHPHMKYQLATINTSWDSILDKNLNLDNLDKILSQWTVKYRSGGHGSCIFLLVLYRYILMWNINLLPLIGLEILPQPKILTWSLDGRTHAPQPEHSMSPAGRGRGGTNIF